MEENLYFLVDLNSYYPEFANYLRSEPANSRLLNQHLEHNLERSFVRTILGNQSLYQSLCSLGKVNHLKKLSWNYNRHFNAIRANNYLAFRLAAGYGGNKTTEYLKRYLSCEDIKLAIKADNYEVIATLTVHSDHLNYIEHLLSYLSFDEIKQAIQAEDYLAISHASEQGNLEVIKYFNSYLTVAEQKKSVQARGYLALKCFQRSNKLKIAKYLMGRLSKDEKTKAIKANSYAVMRAAFRTRDLGLIRYFESFVKTNEKIFAIRINNYEVIRTIARFGDLQILKHLESYLTPDEKNEAISTNNYEVIRLAARLNASEILFHLFHNHIALAYAVTENRIYINSHLVEFANKKINELQRRFNSFNSTGPDSYFKLEQYQLNIYSYIVIYLFRVLRTGKVNSKSTKDKIDFLLGIPEIKTFCIKAKVIDT